MGLFACRLWQAGAVAFLAVAAPLSGQVIEFRSSGMDYQVLTRRGLTVMCAEMPLKTARYALVHVAVSNGSKETWQVDTADFAFKYESGKQVQAVSEQRVIDEFFRTARRSELVKLQAAYEAAVYTNQYIRPNNSYEKRRLSALAIGPKGLKASAAAAAITFVSGKVHPGESTDGAIFFPVAGRSLGQGRIVAQLGGESFEFLSR